MTALPVMLTAEPVQGEYRERRCSCGELYSVAPWFVPFQNSCPACRIETRDYFTEESREDKEDECCSET
jgi:hypothetical protein